MSNHIDHEALEWTEREARRALTAAEQAAFAAWIGSGPRHQGAYLRARAIQHTLNQATLPDILRPVSLDEDDAVAAAATSTAAATPAVPAPAPPRRHLAWAGMAAAALLTAGLAVLWPRAEPALLLQTAKGELRNVPLADHSVVSMNSATRLEVSIDQAGRRIELDEGEAWFQVAKDTARPFVVAAGDVRVRAVGTAFAVRRQPGGADVVVTEGVVEVWRATDRQPRRVAAGEQTSVAQDRSAIDVRRQPDATARQLAWRDGMIILHNQTLAHAVAEFNRYNARPLVIADPRLRDKTFVGKYRVNEAEHFARDVQALLRVPVAIGADRISIGAAAAAPPARP